MNKTTDRIEALLAGLPDLDRHRKVDGLPPDEADNLAQRLIEAGSEAIIELIDRSPAEYDDGDYRPRYLVHLTASYACRPGMEAARRMLASALAAALDGERSEGHKAFIIGELQYLGLPSAAPALGRALVAGSDRLCECAARALQAIGVGGPLIEALDKLDGAPRRSVINALAPMKLAEAAPALRTALADPDADTRILASHALAQLGDRDAIQPLLTACQTHDGWEGIQHARSAIIMAERLAAAGHVRDARRVYTRLGELHKHEKDQYLRDVVQRGIAQLRGTS